MTIVSLTVLLTSCKSEKQKVEESSLESIRTYLDVNLVKEIDDFKSLDSLRIIKIDTITEKQELKLPIEYAINSATHYNRLTNLSIEMAKNKQTIANLGSTIYGGYVNKLEHESAAEEREKVKKYNDSAKLLLNMADSLQKKQSKADSTTLKYYAVKCLIQYTKKDMTFEKDTAVIPVSKDFRVVEYKQITKQYLGNLY
ncbi:MAG: hypothetical protein ACR2KZ_09605 [Segetibacter sp.]